MSVTADNDWIGPARNQTWNISAEDWLAEYSATKNITNCSIRTQPHFLQLEFYEWSVEKGSVFMQKGPLFR